jgi:hypothetical protein
MGSVLTTSIPDVVFDSSILLDRFAMSVIRWRSLSLENRASRSLILDRLNQHLIDKSRTDRLQLKDIEVEANRVTTTQPRYSKEEFARRGVDELE